MLRALASAALALIALSALALPARASPAPLDCCGDGSCLVECTEGCAAAGCGACCNAVADPCAGVVCSATSQCKIAGSCSGGTCSTETDKVDGTACTITVANDGTCTTGSCVSCACTAPACIYQPAIWTYTLDACPASPVTLDNMAVAITSAYAAGFSGIPALTVTTTSGVCDPATGVVVFTTALPNPLDSCALPAGYDTYAEIVAAGAVCVATDPCAAACLEATCTAANDGGVNVNSVVGS
jgi:hypothetical protein